MPFSLRENGANIPDAGYTFRENALALEEQRPGPEGPFFDILLSVA